ncbi:MAG TPA: SHOCT domain-containing protein [Candidatus Dormibacteraeota bacterium]
MRVSVRFFDDETIEGNALELTFEQPDFQLEVEGAEGLENNEMAWIPLNAVKWVEFPGETIPPSSGSKRKVAIRFFDGEVLRGYTSDDVARYSLGFVLLLHPEADSGGTPRRLGIPFSAIKAVFYVRQFDGRTEEQRGLPSESYLAKRTMAPLLDVMDEMEMLQKLHESGVISEAEFREKRTAVLERL